MTTHNPTQPIRWSWFGLAFLKQDMGDVMAPKVEKTPTFYVNGKPLLVFGEEGLRALVREEVKASYP